MKYRPALFTTKNLNTLEHFEPLNSNVFVFLFQIQFNELFNYTKGDQLWGALGLNGFEEVCGPAEVQCVCNGSRVVGESRREERRDREEFSEILKRWA